MSDMLSEMFDTQVHLQNRLYNGDIPVLVTRDQTEYIKEHSIHLTQELHEMLYELPYFKPWKDYSTISSLDVQMQKQLAKEEFVDMFHFMLNIMIGLHMTTEELHDMFMKKNKINHARQDAGYTYKPPTSNVSNKLTDIISNTDYVKEGYLGKLD